MSKAGLKKKNKQQPEDVVATKKTTAAPDDKKAAAGKTDDAKAPAAAAASTDTTAAKPNLWETHKKWWISGIVVAGFTLAVAATALILAFAAPAVFAAIVSFPIFGVTLAAITASTGLQIGLLATIGLAVSAAGVGLYHGAIAAYEGIKTLFAKKPDAAAEAKGDGKAADADAEKGSSAALSKLSKEEPAKKEKASTEEASAKSSKVTDESKPSKAGLNKKKPKAEEVIEEAPASSPAAA